MKAVILLIKIVLILEDSANDGALKGGLIGAFVGLLAGPFGVLFGYGIGSLYGLAGGDTVEAVQEGLNRPSFSKIS